MKVMKARPGWYGIFWVGLALGFTWAIVASGAPQAASPSHSFFPVAVWYGGGKARAPMLEPVDSTSAERWGKDLDQIKAVGFNTVKCWVDWATAEPKPGQYDFQNLNLLMRLAQERGLRVIVQIYTDSAPDWVGQRYPDARFVDRSGAVINSQAAPGFCIDDEAVRNEVVKFIEALSQDANHYDALYGWDVWSEPHLVNWAGFDYLKDPEFCYCRYTQARFRDWLAAKYKTLPALNNAWYRGFTSWNDVTPPRFSTILSFTDYLDWRAFITDKLAADLKTRVDAVRSADHIHPVTSHAAVPGLFTDPRDGYGEPDDFLMSDSADFFGTSLYPKHAESPKPWSYEHLAAGLDFSRSAGHSHGKGFWIGELQAGQGVTGMRIAEPVTGHDEAYWMWQVIAHGAREIAVYAWYPMNAGYESNGYGLINLDGTLTPRAKEAGATAKAIAQSAASIDKAQPAPAQVAILYNRLSYMVGGTEPSLSTLGNAERDSLEGLHRAFLEARIPVDFVSTQDVIDGRVKAYKILFLPYAVMISRQVADGIKQYVEQGGTAVAGARLAWNNARGFASDVIPGFGLAQVFGAREQMIRPVKAARLLVESSPDLPGMKSAEAVRGDNFEEELEPLAGGQVLARFANGKPAMVEKTYGKGKAILAGTFLPLSYEREHDPSTGRLLRSLAQAAGVRAEVKVSGAGTGEVEVRRLVSPQEQLAFIFNHAQKPAQASISIRVPWSVREAEDVVTGRPVKFKAGNNEVVLERNLRGGEIWVVKLSSAS
ncbi:MAG TPA: beta-galactosidase [Terriglobia bacterium]|nr:beta-galactosidase [Terriglobia bacterium]